MRRGNGPGRKQAELLGGFSKQLIRNDNAIDRYRDAIIIGVIGFRHGDGIAGTDSAGDIGPGGVIRAGLPLEGVNGILIAMEDGVEGDGIAEGDVLAIIGGIDGYGALGAELILNDAQETSVIGQVILGDVFRLLGDGGGGRLREGNAADMITMEIAGEAVSLYLGPIALGREDLDGCAIGDGEDEGAIGRCV